MKNTRAYIFSLALASILLMGACGCEKGGPKEDPVPQQDTIPQEEPDMSLVTTTVPVTQNWIWSEKPQIVLHVKNPNAAAVKLNAQIRISTDSKKAVTEIFDTLQVAGKSEQLSLIHI